MHTDQFTEEEVEFLKKEGWNYSPQYHQFYIESSPGDITLWKDTLPYRYTVEFHDRETNESSYECFPNLQDLKDYFS